MSKKYMFSLKEREFGSVPGAYSQTHLNYRSVIHCLYQCKNFKKEELKKKKKIGGKSCSFW